jgi:hypothetical protein
MAILVLSLFLVAVIGGCACVFWAARGGPRRPTLGSRGGRPDPRRR